jgi:hypothetical protein
LSDVLRSGATKDWLPLWQDGRGHEQPWDEKAYQVLRTTIESRVPPGRSRSHALARIQSLDCANPDKTLSSCDPSAAPPSHATEWRATLEAAGVDDKAYAKALAKILKDPVCSGSDDAIYIARGAGFRARLLAARLAAPDLINDLTSKGSEDCPLSQPR